jgi:hypothetical protein
MNGTLIQKIQRQLASSTMSPPISGPIASATLDSAVQMPSARERSSPGNATVTSASDSEISAAAPRPWIARPPISCSGSMAVAETTDPTPKTTIPAWNERLRPSRSPARLRVTTNADIISR